MPQDRAAGWALIASATLSVVAMTHHPTVSGNDMTEVIDHIGRHAGLNKGVHGAMIAFVAAQAFGFLGFADRLGLSRPAARAGLVAWLLGAVAMVGAAVVSGFLVSDLAARFAGSGADPETFRPLLQFSHTANQVLARLGVVAMSAGILAWSVLLLDRARPALTRGLGGLGVVVALVATAGLVGGLLHLNVHGMLLVVVAQAAWTVGVGVQLVRGRVAA